jgi:hypothetical protein
MLTLARANLDKSQGLFSKNVRQETQAIEQMQKVMSNLTLMLGERDQEVAVLQGVNRELS